MRDSSDGPGMVGTMINVSQIQSVTACDNHKTEKRTKNKKMLRKLNK